MKDKEYQVITTAWNVLYEGTDREEAQRVYDEENGFQILSREGNQAFFVAEE